ncbi:hypothetical protein HM1_1296 [Heliomicrobium modesticaldum Ice1]|uniref:Uncharacterized protein n=1 Tax=Heliobacterium modesticaldum (strain ATCC 51547 / Ice1) TaxID=498761 RepID=B0TGM0_HELMI|nr:hypothetical protein HM1_1296 [Heliomicrobium modesticaldum Ice1]
MGAGPADPDLIHHSLPASPFGSVKKCDGGRRPALLLR